MAAIGVLRREQQAAQAEWSELLYSACETLIADSERIMTSMSVTLPRTECPDNSAEVNLLSTGLAQECGLQVTVEVRQRTFVVRFARLPARG